MKTPAPDLRVARTLRKLEKALFANVRGQEPHKLTVKSLCDAAGISRSTFYDYFQSVPQLLDYFTDLYMQQFEEGLKAYLLTRQSYGDYYRWLLTYIKKRREVFKCLFYYNAHLGFMEKIQYFINQDFQSQVIARYTSLSSGDVHFMKVFAQYGATGVIRHWLMDDCRQPVEEVAQLLTAYVERVSCMSASPKA